MANVWFYCQFKQLLYLLLIISCGMANAKQNCSLQYNNFSPLSQNIAELEERIKNNSIEPKDVLKLSEVLVNYMSKDGMQFSSRMPLLKIQSALPRTNLILAYDIFLLSQLYNQQQLGLVSIPPQLSYPAKIVPSHVYQWLDASVALWRCHSKNSITDQTSTDIPEIQVTPSDVYYKMAAIHSQLMTAIKPELLKDFLVLRILEVEFLLQDIFLERSIYVSQSRLKKIEIKNKNIDDLLLSSLKLLSELNGQVYLSENQYIEDIGGNKNYQFQLISSALLAGELLYFNVNNSNVEHPPMQPILKRKMTQSSMQGHIVRLYEMLTILSDSVR